MTSFGGIVHLHVHMSKNGIEVHKPRGTTTAPFVEFLQHALHTHSLAVFSSVFILDPYSAPRPPPSPLSGPPRASAPARRRALTGGFLAQGIATAGVPAICQAFRHFRYITRTSPPCPLPLFLPLPHLTCIPRAGHAPALISPSERQWPR